MGQKKTMITYLEIKTNKKTTPHNHNRMVISHPHPTKYNFNKELQISKHNLQCY